MVRGGPVLLSLQGFTLEREHSDGQLEVGPENRKFRPGSRKFRPGSRVPGPSCYAGGLAFAQSLYFYFILFYILFFCSEALALLEFFLLGGLGRENTV